MLRTVEGTVMSEAFEMVLPFDTDHTEFARGVEVGVLWHRLCTEPLPITAVVHASNAEMVLRMAEAVGASPCADDLGDEWLAVTLG